MLTLSRLFRFGRTTPRPQAPALVSNEELILTTFRQLLDREPDKHEMIHWTLSLGGGTQPDQMVRSICATYEHQMRQSKQRKIVVDMPGFKLHTVDSDMDVSRTLINSKSYEPHVTAALKTVLKSGDTFLDLGANIGYFSMLAASIVGATGRVIGFEPNLHNERLIYSSILDNNFKHVRIYPLAVSNEPQILTLQAFGSNGYLEKSFVEKPDAQFVQAVVPDDLLAAESRINVVKMDIEGFEPFAIEGLTRTIAKHRPTILTEFNPWHITHRAGIKPFDYLKQIERMGYRMTVLHWQGHTISTSSADEVHEHWRSYNHDKMSIDLMAQPV